MWVRFSRKREGLGAGFVATNFNNVISLLIIALLNITKSKSWLDISRLILLDLYVICTNIHLSCAFNPRVQVPVNGFLKARLHRRFLLWSFSFWCLRLNGLTYECVRPSVQSYLNQYFCDSTTQSHASEWEKSPRKSPV